MALKRSYRQLDLHDFFDTTVSPVAPTTIAMTVDGPRKNPKISTLPHNPFATTYIAELPHDLRRMVDQYRWMTHQTLARPVSALTWGPIFESTRTSYDVFTFDELVMRGRLHRDRLHRLIQANSNTIL